MAERRMLAKSIIDSDAFSCMPVESQMLYVRLNMAADDDGFVSNPRSVMRMCGASEDAMKLLIAKKFVLTFEMGDNFIFLIKHWKIHNYIRTDRYRASTFKNLLRDVYYDENKAYSMTPGEGKTPVLPSTNADTAGIPGGIPGGRQAGDERETQDRLGKSKDIVSIGEDSTGKRECEGENPTLPAEDPPPLTPEQRKERIDFLRNRIRFFREMHMDPDCWYRTAYREGITLEELEKEEGDTA